MVFDVLCQVVNIGNVSLKVDYVPGGVDTSALRHGDFLELLKLVPIEGMELELSRVEVWQCMDWGEVGGTIAAKWAHHIKKHQVGYALRFVCVRLIVQ